MLLLTYRLLSAQICQYTHKLLLDKIVLKGSWCDALQDFHFQVLQWTLSGVKQNTRGLFGQKHLPSDSSRQGGGSARASPDHLAEPELGWGSWADGQGMCENSPGKANRGYWALRALRVLAKASSPSPEPKLCVSTWAWPRCTAEDRKCITDVVLTG